MLRICGWREYLCCKIEEIQVLLLVALNIISIIPFT